MVRNCLRILENKMERKYGITEKAIFYSQKKLLTYLGAHFLSMEDIKHLSGKLAEKVNDNYQPDLIVGIDRGGVYPAYCLSQELGIPYTTIDISRKRISFGNVELNSILFLPKLLNITNEPPTIKRPFKYEYDTQKILIIDDDCGSMQTLDLARAHLKERGLEVVTSVILNTPHGTPDFFADYQFPLSKFIKGGSRFPWTQYSPYFQDYQSWIKDSSLKTNKLAIENKEHTKISLISPDQDMEPGDIVG